MHEYLERHLFEEQNLPTTPASVQRKEVFVGDVMQAAIDSDLNVETVIFKNGSYIDIGTPDDLYRAVKTGLKRKMTVHTNERE